MSQESSRTSSKQFNNETSKNENPQSTSSNEETQFTQIARMNLELQENGSFRICCPPSRAKETADVLRKLSNREQELWSRRFSVSCLETILADDRVDRDTRHFYDDIAKKLKEL